MNSSTNPPHKQARKFQFETDFALEEERLRVESLHFEEAQAEEFEAEDVYVPPAPVFSEEEMQYAREEAYKHGHAAGADEARQSIENALSGLINQLIVQIETLNKEEAQRVQEVQGIALQTVVSVIKKVWPSVITRVGLEQVMDTIRQSLGYNPDEARIVIRVHDTLLDAVINTLPQIESQQAFSGKIIVIADQAVAPGDCKVEWADGGMERLSRDMSTHIESAIEHIMALVPKSHQNAGTERTSQ